VFPLWWHNARPNLGIPMAARTPRIPRHQAPRHHRTATGRPASPQELPATPPVRSPAMFSLAGGRRPDRDARCATGWRRTRRRSPPLSAARGSGRTDQNYSGTSSIPFSRPNHHGLSATGMLARATATRTLVRARVLKGSHRFTA
ncbi:hypothetical protein TraAM80_08704, partial [Trypanosoma rangeli]